MQRSRKEILNLFSKIAFLTLVISCNRVESSNATSRIIGGTLATISEFPFLVNLRKNGEFVCGGSLISSRFVITAAHCIYKVAPKTLTVVGGATLLSQKGVRSKVDKVMRPRSFNMQTFSGDIAVLKLSSPIVGNNIKPIRLCRGSWKAGDVVKIAGWGLTSENGASPNQVRMAKIRLMSKRTCSKFYRGVAKLTNKMFCASVRGKKDSCYGDSGGPVIYRGRLCGVVSFGIGCGRANYPGVYANIRTLRKFINRAIRSS